MVRKVRQNAIFGGIIVGCFFLILCLLKNNIKLQYDLDVLTCSFQSTIPDSALIIADHIEQEYFDTMLQDAIYELTYATDYLSLVEDSERLRLQSEIANKLKNIYINHQFQLLSTENRIYISEFMGYDYFRLTDLQPLDEFSMYLTSIIPEI